MSTLMYMAPVQDLRAALVDGKLGSLNPVPWAVMTGNCLGWTAYAWYTRDPFILASNIPGIIVSVWLNLGAAKLQYHGIRETQALEENAGNGSRRFVLGPQEDLLLRILLLWISILVSVGWLGMTNGHQIETIGILVNINLLFFYGAPLQTIKTVVSEKNSASIHRPLMRMNWLNTSLWVFYGLVAKNDPVIYGPNAVGLIFGLIQGVLCCIYPARVEPDVDTEPLLGAETPVASTGSADDVDVQGEHPSELV